MSDTPNINIGGITGGQNNIGKNEIAGNQIQNNLPPKHVTETMNVIAKIDAAISKTNPDLAKNCLPELTRLAKAPAPEQQQNLSRIETLCKSLRPHAELIWTTIATFGRGALESIAKTNPVINGIWEVCKHHSEK